MKFRLNTQLSGSEKYVLYGTCTVVVRFTVDDDVTVHVTVLDLYSSVLVCALRQLLVLVQSRTEHKVYENRYVHVITT